MSIKPVMPSSHLILCSPLLLLPPIPPSIRVFSNESTLRMRWPKYWSFSFSIIPSKEIPGLISLRMDWLDLLAVQGTLKSLLQHHSSKASILRHSAFFTVQLSHPYMTTGKTISMTRQTFVDKVMSLIFNMLSRLVITFLPRSKCLLMSWLQSPSAVILEPPKIKSDTVSTVSPSICHRLAISQAASAKDRVMDMIDVTQWSAMESSKTATTTVNTNIRGRADLQESSSFLGRLGTMVSGWLGMETAKTGATTTGVATRTAVQEAGQAQGQAAEAANAGKSIMTSANEAAAATYANVSKIPYVGWILAPAAAAVAFGAVAAYDVVSAEGGLGQVPKDGTKAILHKDETVLPSSIATPLRSALANQTIGGLGVNMAKTTSSALSSMATGMQKMADSSGNQSIHIYPNFNVNAIDQKTGAQFLMSNMKTIVNGFAREIRNNNTNLFGKNSAINV